MIASLGRHVLAEVYGCQFEVLNDIALVKYHGKCCFGGWSRSKVVFTSLAARSHGVVISESHLAIHTSQLGYAVDVYLRRSVNLMPVITWLRNLGLPM